MLAWFFKDPASRYTLSEVVTLTQCSRDDVQNWVRRKMIEPDETTPGRRIYYSATVATLRIAAMLRLQGESANHSLMHAHLTTDAAFRWFAGAELPDGAVPEFEKDFRQHYAAIVTFVDSTRPPAEPSAPGQILLPGIAYVSIFHRSDIDAWLKWPCVRIVRLHWVWLALASGAYSLKERAVRTAERTGQA